MVIERFIDRLEQWGLLDKAVVDDLRRKVARSKGKKITPEVIVKYLLDKGHLTRFQATRLVSDMTNWTEAGGGPGEAKKAKDTDQLTLLPDDVDPKAVRELEADTEASPGRPDRAGRERLDEGQTIDERVDEKKDAAGEKPAAKEKRDAGRRDEERKGAAPQSPVPPPVSPPVRPQAKTTTAAAAPVDDWASDLEAGSPPASDRDASRGPGGLGGGGGSRSLAQRKLQKSSEWDSVLLLVGGASLGVLLIVGGFLYLSLTRGVAEDLFAAAESAYRDQSYSQAIKLYDEFIEDYSGHEKASMARVKRRAAQLRQVFEDPERGLKVAREELPGIEQEEAFSEIRPELASMLPRIARGFVDEAMLADDPAVQESLLEKTDQAMALVDNPDYIPATLRRSQQTTIDRIEADVERVKREIDRERNLAETIDTIAESVAAGDTQTAHEARQALLNKYPGLDADERLHEATLTISDKEREKVKVVNESLQAVTDDAAPRQHPGVILSHGRGQPVPGVNDYVAFVLVNGSVFALDAATGDVLWQRFVGMETTTFPIAVSNSPNADAIVVDRRTQDIMRLEARTGKLLWRLRVDERFADPVLRSDRLYLSCQSGRLLPVDVETGNVSRYVQIPQPLEVGPGATVRREHFYQPGDQGNLYVIDSETLECDEVFYIGHKRGTIAVPPVVAFGCLFVLENSGPDFCDLHIIRYDENGLNLRSAQSRIRLQGQVLVPPVVGRRRVLVVTDRRAVKLYDVEEDAVNAWEGLHGTKEEPIISYPVMANGYMWIANDQFAKYQVQATTGQLPAEWALSERDVYVGPLRMVRDTIIHVRRRQRASGYTVAATRIDDKEPSWETELAVPVRNLAVNGETVEAVTSRGRLFKITEEAVSRTRISTAAASVLRDERLTLSLSKAINVQDGSWVMAPSSGYNQVVFHRTTGENPGLKMLTLTVPLGQAAAEPTPFADGLLVPLHNGRVALCDRTTGGEQARPFHPEVEAATDTQWHPAAVVKGGDEFVIASEDRQIYHVGIDEKPEPHLSQLGASAVSDDVVGPLAAAGEGFFAVTRSPAEDKVTCFALPEIKTVQQWTLNRRLRWGPRCVGDTVMLSTDVELVCMDAGPRQRWTIDWEHGPIVGRPLVLDRQVLLAAEDGTVVALNMADGTVMGEVDVGEPLDWGPIVFSDQVFVASKSGVLFVVARPSA